MSFNITQISMLHILSHLNGVAHNADGTTVSGSHSTLDDLDYDSSGHTGFVSLVDLATTSGSIQSQIDDKADATHDHDGIYQPAGDYSTTAELTTLSGVLQNEIDTIELTPGPQGEVGPQGPQGIQGPAGTNGIDGEDGLDGAQGPQGEVGPQGPAGAAGTDGVDGEDGAQGPQGEVGPAGAAGAQGPQGIQGPAGPGFENIEDYATWSGVATISGSLQYQIDNITVSGGGDSLPDQTGNAGKYLATDGTDAYWATVSGTTSSGSYLEEVVDDTSPQLGGDLDLNEHYITLEATPASDLTGSGEIILFEVYSNAIGPGCLFYNATSGRCSPARANEAATMPCMGLAIESGTGLGKKLLLRGVFRDDSWAWTPGYTLYVSDSTAGEITQTPPSTSGYIVQAVGFALSADTIYFNPSYITVELA